MNPYRKGFIDGLQPDPRLTVSEWAEKYRVLTTESSAEAGLWRNDRTPYLKAIMDELSPTSPVEQVKVIKGTQLGFSEAGINTILCYLDLYPSPILFIQPTETLMKGTSKRRITPSIRAIERLARKIKPGKTKNDLGEIYIKEVPGGTLTMGWSNSTASFRSFSARLVVLDDVDGFGGDFGEGNPLDLGKARTDAFSNRKIYINSTPTTEGHSAIEREYTDSDQREYFMPCPHCGKYIKFEWENFKLNGLVRRADGTYRIKKDVVYQCPECGGSIEEYQKTKMLRDGKWIAQNPGHPHAGFRLPSFYSPVGWLSWRQIALEYLRAYMYLKKGDASLMQVWQNTRNARPFKEVLKGVEIADAESRKEDYPAEVPDPVNVLVAGVDTQDNRFEVVTLGLTQDEQIYFIDYEVIPGDPASLATQEDLDAYLFDKEFKRANGAVMKIYAAGIDTGGHRTAEMYKYCQDRHLRKVFGLKGASTLNAPVVNKTFKMAVRQKGFVPYIIGTIALKDDFFQRLGIIEEGPRFVHFPNLEKFDDEFFKMLTAEQRDETGRYVAVRKRNEALDCTLYALVSLTILGADVKKLTSPILHIGERPSAPAKKKPRRRRKTRDYLDEF